MAKKPKASASLAAAIAAKGYSWQSATTPLSTLSLKQQQSYLGLRVTKETLAATERTIAAATSLRALQAPAVAAPPAIDWRNNNGDWTTPVKDQQSCGSCVSFGTCGTFESRIKIACKSATMAVDLSEAHLFYCGCGNCCDTGWDFGPALDFCKQTGVANDADFPYTPGNQPCKQGLAAYAKISGWTQIAAIPDRKTVLATKGPVVGGLAVYQDFFSYRSGVYRHTQGALAGYHAVSVVGYDDSQSCWICKNSWNTTWGDNGWFRIGYGECGMDSQFFFYDMDAICPGPPTDDCKQYVAVLVRILQAARVNAALRACLRYYVCGIGPRPRCSASQIAVVKAVLAILKRCPQYRKPFCRALG